MTALRSILSWTYYRDLSKLKNIDEIVYYINECVNKNLTTRQLSEIIKSNTYNRLSDETKNKLNQNNDITVTDLVPNPIVIKVDNLKEKLTEYILKESILCNLDSFLKQ